MFINNEEIGNELASLYKDSMVLYADVVCVLYDQIELKVRYVDSEEDYKQCFEDARILIEPYRLFSSSGCLEDLVHNRELLEANIKELQLGKEPKYLEAARRCLNSNIGVTLLNAPFKLEEKLLRIKSVSKFIKLDLEEYNETMGEQRQREKLGPFHKLLKGVVMPKLFLAVGFIPFVTLTSLILIGGMINLFSYNSELSEAKLLELKNNESACVLDSLMSTEEILRQKHIGMAKEKCLEIQVAKDEAKKVSRQRELIAE